MEQIKQKANLPDLEKALSLFLPGAIFFGCAENFNPQNLLPEEISYFKALRSAKRAAQFGLGRTAARVALAKLAGPDSQFQKFPLLKMSSGLVDWPQSIVGSISHSHDLAVALVAKEPEFRSIGVDFELFREVGAATIARIACPKELGVLSALNVSENKLFFFLFSGKESIFKALFPVLDFKFGFRAVQLTAIRSAEFFSSGNKAGVEAVCCLDFAVSEQLSGEFHAGYMLEVRLVSTDYFCLTLCTLPGVS